MVQRGALAIRLPAVVPPHLISALVRGQSRGAPLRFARLAALPITVPARRRRLDDVRFTGIDIGRVAAPQPSHAAVVPAPPVLADLTRLAAGQAAWRHPPMARQDRALHRLEKTNGAPDAIARL